MTRPKSGAEFTADMAKHHNDKVIESFMEAEDMVNNPKHYADSCGFECIDLMEKSLSPKIVIDFCLGNAFKYIFRHPNKNGSEDLDKAEWYLKYADDLVRTYSPIREFDTADLAWLKIELKKARERWERR